MDKVAELSTGRQQTREYGFREAEKTDKIQVLDQKDMPWAPEAESPLVVPLSRVTLQDGNQFFLGSAIIGKDLNDAASSLTVDESERANKLFYAGIQRHLGSPHGTKRVDGATTERPIYYISNGRGATRIYFMDLKDEKGQCVIMRIAVSQGKGKEIKKVLPVITSENVKTIKERCLRK